jgi:pimeloyl-ACP methyl ester carboxylesterase
MMQRVSDVVIKESTVEVDGRRIFYRQAGSGDPVVLLHGSHRSSYLFQPVLATLGRSYTVIAPDRPGYGESDAIRDDEPLPDMAEFASNFINALGLDTAHWIGESRGGGICISLAVRRPRVVRSLVLVAPIGLPPRELPKPAEVGSRSVWEWFLERSLEQPDLLDEEDKEAILANLAKADSYERRRLRDQAASYAAEGLLSEIIRIQAPVLLVWGRQDPVFPVECVERFRQLIPDLREVLIVDNARHLAHFEQSEAFCEGVRSFLGNNFGSPAGQRY